MKIKILSHEYEVIHDQKMLSVETSDPMGVCDNLKHIIIVGESQKESSAEETLFHEIIEALNYRLKLGLDHDKQLTVLSETLLMTLIENGMYKSLLEQGATT